MAVKSSSIVKAKTEETKTCRDRINQACARGLSFQANSNMHVLCCCLYLNF